MAKERDQQRNWMEKMKHTYRLVVMNNETFEEIGSYRLSLLNVYIAASTAFVIMAILFYSLVAFTPLRRYIPGYGDARNDDQLYEMTQQMKEMEKELAAQRKYTENVRKVLVGDVETAEEVLENTKEENAAVNDSLDEVERALVDAELRQEVELDEIGTMVRNGRTTNLSSLGLPLEQIYFSSPVTGEISAGFMPDKKHFGVDILAPKNTAIKAALDGFVFLSDWTLETGNTIGIQHANNVITFYKHNSVLLKQAGSFVRAGEAVAIIGNTGTLSDGPHLHFELWHRGQAVDPTEFINF